MNDEPKRRGRPPKALTGAETISKEWEHPPLQGHEEEQESAAVSKNPTEDVLSVATGTNLSQDSTLGSPEDSQPSVPNVETITPLTECPPGYFPIETAPKDLRIVVSETGEDQTAVYWRIRKVVDKKNLRYLPKGAWTDCLSRLDIDFGPRYWRTYVSSDYVPVPRAK